MSVTGKNSETRPQINLRVSAPDRRLIDLAAEATGTSRSEFMLSAARKAAEEALMERVLFPLDAADWDAFTAALDSPHPHPERLARLRSASKPWQA